MKLKALAAAVALMSTASVANAAWMDGIDDNLYADGELLLVAFDDVRKVSVVQDLGGSYVEFYNNLSSSSFNKSFTLDPLFASTFASSAASNIQWSIYANSFEPDGFGSTQNTPGFLVTTNAANPEVGMGQFDAHQNSISGLLSLNVNGALPNGLAGNYAENGAFYGDAANSLYAGTDAFYGNNLVFTTPNFNVTGLSNETLMFWAFMEETVTGNGADLKFNGYWTLDIANDSVSYSAVPVPAAIWLLASGLLGLGAVSRRRKV